MINSYPILILDLLKSSLLATLYMYDIHRILLSSQSSSASIFFSGLGECPGYASICQDQLYVTPEQTNLWLFHRQVPLTKMGWLTWNFIFAMAFHFPVSVLHLSSVELKPLN